MKPSPRVILSLLALLLLAAACATTPPAGGLAPTGSDNKTRPTATGEGVGLPLISERGTLFSAAGVCATCHAGSVDAAGKDVALDTAWRASIHANAARDPYWLATVRSEVTTAPALAADLQKKCATCHMPMAEVTLAKDKQPVTILDGGLADAKNALHPLAVDGVSCTACHQVEPEGLGKPESFSGGFAINTQLPQGQRLAYGPYPPDDASVAMMQAVSGFIPKEGQHLAQAGMCGACHNLYTPTLDTAGQVAGEFAEQLIFSEWQNSAYAQSKPCQACHMPAAQGAVKSAITGGQARQPFMQHTFTGGNATLLRLLAQNSAALQVTASTQQLNAAAQSSADLLASQTARLTLLNPRVEGGRLLADVAVESLVGHKFPAGYPSRRAWLHIRVLDKDGKVVFESGAPGANGAISGNDNDADPARYEPHYAQITAPDQVQIYEGILSTTEGKVTTQLLRASGYLKDNRLLPAGFKPDPAIPALAPQGEAAKDANFTPGGDRLSLALDVGKAAGPFTLEARLLYQSIAYRWAANLAAEPGAEQVAFKKMMDGTPNIPLVAASARVSVTPSVVPYPLYVAYPLDRTPGPTPTARPTATPFIKFTQRSPTLTALQISEKIAACYQTGTGCSACEPKLNNSVQYVRPTVRTFINVPKELYPIDLFQYQTSVNGQAGFGWISNGGLPGYASGRSPECWSTYVEFTGQGEVDLRIPSILIGVPDYFVRFIVGWGYPPEK